MHRFFEHLRAPLHIAHRGGGLLYPENTLLAFEAAVERHQTQMIELDVHASADGELVVFHDDDLDRTTDGTGPLRAQRWVDLQRLDAAARFELHGAHPYRGQGVGIPRLVEVLRAFPELPLNLELKPERPELAQPIVDLLRAEGALHRVCLGSAFDTVGEALHAAAPEACHYYPQAALTAFVMAALTSAPVPEDPRYSVLDMPLTHRGVRLVTPALLAAARAAGKWVNVWTVDDAAEMRALVDLGVGGVMTDRPDVLRAVFDQREDQSRG